jgi:hypothetical protein
MVQIYFLLTLLNNEYVQRKGSASEPDASLLALDTLQLVTFSPTNDALSVLICTYRGQSVSVCRRLKSYLTSRLQTCLSVHVQIWQTTSSMTYCSVGCVLTLPELCIRLL